MEYPQSLERFNAKLRLIHPSFQELINEAEAEVNAAMGDPDRIVELIEEHESYMEDSIGDDCYLHEAAVTGFMYQTDENEQPNGALDYVSTEQTVFHAMRLVKIGDAYKVVLQFTLDDYLDDQDVYHAKELYYAIPQDVAVFDIFVEEPIMEVISRHIDHGPSIVTDPSFYNLSFEMQATILQEAAARVDFDLPLLERFGVAFDVSRYIALADDSEGDIRDCIVDQSHLEREDRVQPQGEYVDCIYPELNYQEHQFKRIQEFDISGGTACIVLRNEEHGVTYFVPLEAIENHDNTYLTVFEQQDFGNSENDT